MNLHHYHIKESAQYLEQWCLDYNSHPFGFLILSCINEHSMVSDISFSLQNNLNLQIKEGKKGNIISYILDSELASFWKAHIEDYLTVSESNLFCVQTTKKDYTDKHYLELPLCQHDITLRLQRTEYGNHTGQKTTHCAVRVLYSSEGIRNLVHKDNLKNLINKKEPYFFPFTLSHWEKEISTFYCREKLLEELESKLEKNKRLKV